MNEPHLASAEFGGFWIRFIAVLADSAIVFLISALIIAGAATALGPESLGLAIAAAWLFGFLYWPVMHASSPQATLGKAMLGLRVTGYQGNRISFLRSLGRELSKILSGAVFMLGYVFAAFTARKQALHDLVASTYVVRDGKARVVAALATAVAGIVLPMVVLPMVVGSAMVDSLMAMVSGMEAHKAAPPPPRVVVVAPKPKPAAAPVVSKAPEPAPAPVVAKTPEPAPAPKPVAVVEAKPVPAVETKPAPVMEAKPAEAKPIETKQVEAKAVVAKKPAVNKAAAPRPQPAPAVVKAAPSVAKPALSPSPVLESNLGPGPKFNDMMTAVLYRDSEAVTELAKLGRWVDKPDSRGVTPLMLAVELGDKHTAEALLQGGADPGRAVALAEKRRDGAMLDLLKRYAAR